VEGFAGTGAVRIGLEAWLLMLLPMMNTLLIVAAYLRRMSVEQVCRR
jgi:hypothetical protein